MKITKLNKILIISLISTICIAAVLFSLVLNKANASEIESNQNQSYTVSVDLAGGVLDSAKPSGWTEKSSLYTKNFDEGTSFDTIMKEWEKTKISRLGFKFNYWDTPDRGNLSKDTTIPAIWTENTCINEYTWEDLKYIAEDISQKWNPTTKKSTSEYYETFKTMADAGDTKDVEFKKGLFTETLHYRIIGICHDLKSDGKPAGLTFAPVNTLPIAYAYGNANQDYAVNWKSSSIREKLQENGEIFKCFPKELTDKITDVKKKYALAFGDEDDWGTYNNSTSDSTDSLFLLSYTELGGKGYTGWPTEGSKYEYIDHDNWYWLSNWHKITYWDPIKSVPAEDQIWPGPVLSSVTDEGYDWIFNNKEIKYPTIFESAIKFVEKWVGLFNGYPEDAGFNQDRVLERTVYPDNLYNVMTLDAYGNPEKHNLAYTDTACINPCFCL